MASRGLWCPARNFLCCHIGLEGGGKVLWGAPESLVQSGRSSSAHFTGRPEAIALP
jgi:hypothetical protein